MVLIQYIIKTHKTLANNSPIHIYINRIIKRLVFKIKDGSKIETQRTETKEKKQEKNSLKEVQQSYKRWQIMKKQELSNIEKNKEQLFKMRNCLVNYF